MFGCRPGCRRSARTGTWCWRRTLRRATRAAPRRTRRSTHSTSEPLAARLSAVLLTFSADWLVPVCTQYIFVCTGIRLYIGQRLPLSCFIYVVVLCDCLQYVLTSFFTLI